MNADDATEHAAKEYAATELRRFASHLDGYAKALPSGGARSGALVRGIADDLRDRAIELEAGA